MQSKVLENIGNVVKQDNLKNMKRVEIKGIEFDWIFTDKEGKEFLTELSETDNMEIFNYDIIKDIIWF